MPTSGPSTRSTRCGSSRSTSTADDTHRRSALWLTVAERIRPRSFSVVSLVRTRPARHDTDRGPTFMRPVTRKESRRPCVLRKSGTRRDGPPCGRTTRWRRPDPGPATSRPLHFETPHPLDVAAFPTSWAVRWVGPDPAPRRTPDGRGRTEFSARALLRGGPAAERLRGSTCRPRVTDGAAAKPESGARLRHPLRRSGRGASRPLAGRAGAPCYLGRASEGLLPPTGTNGDPDAERHPRWHPAPHALRTVGWVRTAVLRLGCVRPARTLAPDDPCSRSRRRSRRAGPPTPEHARPGSALHHAWRCTGRHPQYRRPAIQMLRHRLSLRLFIRQRPRTGRKPQCPRGAGSPRGGGPALRHTEACPSNGCAVRRRAPSRWWTGRACPAPLAIDPGTGGGPSPPPPGRRTTTGCRGRPSDPGNGPRCGCRFRAPSGRHVTDGGMYPRLPDNIDPRRGARGGGDGRLAEPWLVRGGRGSLSPPAGISRRFGRLAPAEARQPSLYGTDRILAIGSGVVAPTFLFTQAVVLSAAMTGLAGTRLSLRPTAPPGSSPTYDGWAGTRCPTLP